MHENAIFQISLLSIKKIFDSFPPKVVNEVSFNGWLNLVNPATGKDEESTLVYLKVTRHDFIGIDLNRVDYRSCIKMFDGFISPSFSEYSNANWKQVTNRKNGHTANSSKTKEDIILTELNDIDSDKNERKRTRKKTDADFDLEFDD